MGIPPQVIALAAQVAAQAAQEAFKNKDGGGQSSEGKSQSTRGLPIGNMALLSSLLGGGGGGQPGTTPGNIEMGLDYLQQATFDANRRINRMPGVAGFGGLEGTPKKSQLVDVALLDFLQQERNLSEEDAKAKLRQINKSDKTARQIKGFRKWLRDNGEQYNLQVDDKTGKVGRIEIGRTAELETDPQRQTMNDINQAILDQMQGFVDQTGEQYQGDLDFRNAIQQNLSNQFGLSDDDINDVLEADMAKIRSGAAQIGRNVMGNLSSSGFLNSSLLGQNLNQQVGGMLDQNTTALQGKMAELRRGQQQMQLGAAQLFDPNLSDFSSSLMNPQNIGAFTDPQAAAFSFGIGQAKSQNMMNMGINQAKLATMPVSPESGGFFSSLNPLG